MKKPKILISNDDGIFSPGIRALWDAMSEIGDPFVVAPDTERSAVGHAITLTDPLRVVPVHRSGGFQGLAVSGTPSDCAKIAIKSILKEKPDLMILIDGLTLRVSVDVRPVFLFGRYLKLERGIPQTRWPCRACRGRGDGCESCSETGLQYLDSVQDLIGEPLRIALDAEDTS